MKTASVSLYLQMFCLEDETRKRVAARGGELG